MVKGYANEIGEAFRALVPRHIVKLSYVVASLYVLADTTDKTIKMHEEQSAKPKYNTGKVVAATVDTLLWQTLASIVIPGITINRLCALANLGLSRSCRFSKPTKKWMVTAIGLASIPIIIKPIDESVTFAMDKLLRPFYKET